MLDSYKQRECKQSSLNIVFLEEYPSVQLPPANPPELTGLMLNNQTLETKRTGMCKNSIVCITQPQTSPS